MDRNISNLEDVLPLLSKFQQLLSLNLDDNSITYIPGEKLSQVVPNIRELNINQNPFESHEQVVTALKHLPHLISLFMSLYEEASVHLIIQELPNLQFLNGIEIQRAEIIR